MADLKDITGWREELEDYYEEGGQEAVNHMYESGVEIWKQEIPVSQVQEYTELLLNHNETRDAMAQIADWEKVKDAHGGNVDPSEPAYEDRPVEAIYLLSDFYEWYCMKTGHRWANHQVNLLGKEMAVGILQGRIDSVRSKESADYLKKKIEFNVFREDKIS